MPTKKRATKAEAKTTKKKFALVIWLFDVTSFHKGETGLIVLPGLKSQISEDAKNDPSTGCEPELRRVLADKENPDRVLFGWSSHRAKAQTLTWSDWDSFLKKHLGEVATGTNRENDFDIKVAMEEARALKVRIVSNPPKF